MITPNYATDAVRRTLPLGLLLLLVSASWLSSCRAPSEEPESSAVMVSLSPEGCCSEEPATPDPGGNGPESFVPRDEMPAEESGEPESCCELPADQLSGGNETELLLQQSSVGAIPDVELTDQHGDKVRFYTDLVKGKVVAMNFIFTTCTTICPPLTANFAKVQQLARGRAGKEFQMISVSVDPRNDTPQRLNAWGEKFGAKPGWTFLTGDKRDVDSLLKALKVFTPLEEDHSPLVLVGDDERSQWSRVYGLAAPAKILKVIDNAVNTSAPPVEPDITAPVELEPVATDEPRANAKALEYFTDVELTDQNGKKQRLYSDLMKDKTVVVSCFFSECVGVCPVLNKNLVAVQEALGSRLGKEVNMLSFSVDCHRDTPQRLKQYAGEWNSRPGWYFLTGDQKNVEIALRKLGLFVESREQHSNTVLIGNDRTSLWKKAFGLSKPEELVAIIESVIADDVETAEVR